MSEFDGAQATILLIDDEHDILDSLAKVLTNVGYVCHCASDCETATRMASKISPDLIISDINLAGYSGLNLCERMKQELNLGQVPLMFLSGAQIPDIIRRAHAAGGTYYLRKPFDPQVLLELVDKALWMPHLVGTRV
jgi:DNA-binding response OmpR family regulator